MDRGEKQDDLEIVVIASGLHDLRSVARRLILAAEFCEKHYKGDVKF